MIAKIRLHNLLQSRNASVTESLHVAGKNRGYELGCSVFHYPVIR